ncbi:MAG: FxDxF family PEP-CTERM protein, partial [Burkholderiales bacterium]|nr:FxDxF family PEP-CTERM protein [Burkholderiales bacterium]
LTFESLNPGEISRYLVMYTNSSMYSTSIASVIDGSVASAATFAPIPEPETYAMMLAGMGLMAFVARRRASKNVS